MEKNFILFGAGNVGKQLLRIIGEERVGFFCDNKKNGEKIEGKKVLSYKEMKELATEYIVVIAVGSRCDEDEISAQLKADGISFLFLNQLGEHVIKKEAEIYASLNTRLSFEYNEKKALFSFQDRLNDAALLDFEFWQDLWAAKYIIENRPQMHYDIGSRVDGLIGHLLAAGQKTTLIDVRKFPYDLPDLNFICVDAANLENIIPDNTIESLSSLYTLHHLGLGRYGDPIDPEACFKCFESIQRKIKPGGYAYISVLIGKEHLEFNVHRVFYASTIKECFSKMELLEFSTVYKNHFEKNVDLNKYDERDVTWKEDRTGVFGLFRFRKM